MIYIVDNFLDQDTLEYLENTHVESLPITWYNLYDDNIYRDICHHMIDVSKKYYNFSSKDIQGYECWSQINSKPDSMHYDKDETMWKKHEKLVFSICSTVLYFNVDDDSTSDKLVFNKTVGLRDSWAKQKPKESKSQNQRKPQQQSQRKAINVIQQLGKKYTNLPEDKQQKAKAEIQVLAKEVTYEELEPLFGTAVKKAGTRIATMIALKVLLNHGLEKNAAITEFIEKALEDNNELLVAEAKENA